MQDESAQQPAETFCSTESNHKSARIMGQRNENRAFIHEPLAGDAIKSTNASKSRQHALPRPRRDDMRVLNAIPAGATERPRPAADGTPGRFFGLLFDLTDRLTAFSDTPG